MPYYHLSHAGYGSGMSMSSPVIAEWLLLLGYVSIIGFIFFRDVAQMKSSLSLLFWGGLAIVLVNVAFKSAASN